MTPRPVSIAHLVFGLIFLGATALWVIGAATDADAPEMAAWGPAVLIGAGVIGLIASLVRSRRNQAVGTDSAAAEDVAGDSNHDDSADRALVTTSDDTDTRVIETEEKQ